MVSPCKITVHRSVTEIPEAEWDSILPRDSLIKTHRFFKAVEESGLDEFDLFYVLARRNGDVAAHCCVYYVEQDLTLFQKGAWMRLVEAIRKIFPSFAKVHMMECGIPVALGTSITVKAGENGNEAVKLLISKMEELSRRFRVKVFNIREFCPASVENYRAIEDLSYFQTQNLPDTFIEHDFVSPEEYFRSLRSKYRNKIKAIERKASPLTVEVRERFDDIADQLLDLYLQVYDRAKEMKREKLTRDFFVSMSRNLGGEARVILMKEGRRPVGFSFVLVDDDTLRNEYIGLDYESNRKYRIYHNLLLHTIRYGIELGKKKIELGITTYTPKKELGARLSPLYMYMKHTNPIMNKIVPRLFKYVFPKQDFTSKNVFSGS
ncbi:MAG: GNAT family N-acetyltransferase [Candidatus Tritonobacter lacicola]|nr:GNAT family N-acetyltransferase [Candidatus Tritonobacter lacicola]